MKEQVWCSKHETKKENVGVTSQRVGQHYPALGQRLVFAGMGLHILFT